MTNTFSLDQKTLLSILAAIQPICTKRTTLDTTSSILFEVGHKELILKSTDLEISLQSNCLLDESDLLEEQSFLVSGKRIFDLVKELDDEIRFTFADNQLSLESSSVKLALHVKDAEGFPPFPERIENLMQFNAEHLLAMLNKVAFIIPQNNANQSLNGLLLEVDSDGLKMTSTDGHCLAQVYTKHYTFAQPKKWLLPRRAIFELKKILENTKNKNIFLGLCNQQLVFSGESFNFFTKLLANQFPDYAAIMQKEGFTPATIDRTHLIKTLRRSSCLLSGQFLATKFDFNKDAVHVSMQNKEIGKLDEALPVHGFDKEQLDIRFYAPYLLNGLQTLADETVTFHLKNSSKPIIFESGADIFTITYLVMPVSPTNG